VTHNVKLLRFSSVADCFNRSNFNFCSAECGTVADIHFWIDSALSNVNLFFFFSNHSSSSDQAFQLFNQRRHDHEHGHRQQFLARSELYSFPLFHGVFSVLFWRFDLCSYWYAHIHSICALSLVRLAESAVSSYDFVFSFFCRVLGRA
jgi:hypothetical protein